MKDKMIIVLTGVAILIVALVVAIPQFRSEQRNDGHVAIEFLRQYLSAQGTYHRTDYDKDGLKEYAADMVCLHDWDGPGGEEPIKLIDIKMAMAHYSRPESGRPSGYDGIFQPDCGSYFTELLGNAEGKNYQIPDGDAGVPGWKDGFSLVAFPAIYFRTSTYCFIINEEGTVYQKDIKGVDLEHLEKLPRFWPSDLKKEGWKMTGE